MAADTNEIHIFSRDFEEFFVQFTEQIGRGEIFVESDELFSVDTPVVVVFSLVYEDLPFFKVNGSVSYVIEPGQTDLTKGQVPGMGVKVSDMDENIRNWLVDLVKRQLKSELSRMFTT